MKIEVEIKVNGEECLEKCRFLSVDYDNDGRCILFDEALATDCLGADRCQACLDAEVKEK